MKLAACQLALDDSSEVVAASLGYGSHIIGRELIHVSFVAGASLRNQCGVIGR